MEVQAANKGKRMKKRLRIPHREADMKIVLLINSPHYFLECVFILLEKEDSYRLLVIHNKRILTDARYSTIKGAKIGFCKYYDKKRWSKNVKSIWSYPYPPDSRWLEAKLKQKIEK